MVLTPKHRRIGTKTPKNTQNRGIRLPGVVLVKLQKPHGILMVPPKRGHFRGILGCFRGKTPKSVTFLCMFYWIYPWFCMSKSEAKIPQKGVILGPGPGQPRPLYRDCDLGVGSGGLGVLGRSALLALCQITTPNLTPKTPWNLECMGCALKPQI